MDRGVGPGGGALDVGRTRNYERRKSVLTEPEVAAKIVVLSPGGVDFFRSSSARIVELRIFCSQPSAYVT